MTDCNEIFREHVTGSAFTLSLGKTHIAALVSIDAWIRSGTHSSARDVTSHQRAFAQSATGLRGLIERGLVIHTPPFDSNGRFVHGRHPRRIWRITKAGRLVANLLKEAGIWQEYEAALPVRDLRVVGDAS